MNCSTYIFGELSEGYSQYPEDSSSNLFKDIQKRCVAPSQLIIHRDESMMYYVYVRKLDKNRFIGFAIAINGYYITQVEPLFSLFEKNIEDLVEKGVIINFSNSGEITSNLPTFSKEEEEVMAFSNSFQSQVNRIRNTKKLPPVDYSVSITSQKLFKENDSLSEIINASYRYGYTIILKESDYDTVRLTSFKNVLKNLNTDKESLIKENAQLRETNQKIQRQKKQFKNVVFLFIIVIGCAVGLYFLYVNLNDTQDRLDLANISITQKESIIVDKNTTISNLRDSVSRLEYNLNREIKAKEKIESSLQSICSYSPFAVTSCEVNASNFKFNYFCPEEKEVTVTLKAVNENNSEIITSTHTLTFYKGTGSKSLDFYRRLDTSQYYYVVLIYDGHIVSGRRW